MMNTKLNMNGSWDVVKGELKQKYANLTDDDLLFVEGKENELLGRLELKLGKPKEEIGAEVHKLDQFFRVEEGSGEAVLDGVRTAIQAGFAVLVPAGANHNIINTGNAPLKLYTLYAPPNHLDGVVHRTRAAAEADTEHFEGRTTE